MNLSGIGHLTLTVTDLDRTSAWYRDVLGFNDYLRYRNDAIGGEWHVLTHPDLPGTIVSFVKYDNGDPLPFDEHIVGLDHVAFCVGGIESLDAWRTHLGTRGIPYSQTHLQEISILVLRDPDNIQVELCTEIVEVVPGEPGSSITVDQIGKAHLT
jgi:catechol 2,3-dioxygenase-like lactoylglutathione lyase family enzyme